MPTCEVCYTEVDEDEIHHKHGLQMCEACYENAVLEDNEAERL